MLNGSVEKWKKWERRRQEDAELREMYARKEVKKSKEDEARERGNM